MGFPSEFSDILRRKMGSMVEETPITPEVPTQKTAPNSPVFPIFSHPKTWLPRKLNSAYPVKKISKEQSKQQKVEEIKIKIAEKIFTQTDLNSDEMKALVRFQTLGGHINAQQICLSTLKKEYRRLAKIYHPDSAKSLLDPKKFHELVTIYHTLEKKLAFLSKP